MLVLALVLFNISVGTHSPESHLCPGLCHKQCGQKVEGGDSPLVLHSCETPPGVLCPVWGHRRKKDVNLLE